MRRRHVMVIDPAVKVAELDCFNRMATAAPLPLTYHLPAMFGMDSVVRDSEGAAGIVVLGSASSIHDRLPWQQPLADWLRGQMTAGVPTLGLCFGHQLVAWLYGATIDYLRPDRSKLEGFVTTELAATTLWGGATSCELYASHREVVTSCPPSLVAIASRPEVPFDGFAHRELPIWTLQTHPEATPAFVAHRGDRPGCHAAGHALVDRFIAFAAG